MNSSNATPMMRQYLTIKKRFADALLFFRMGDFYELFFEDAEKASRLLDIALTTRNKHEKNPVPMCGVPVKSVQGYIARLIDRGYKVALCDQTEDAKSAKGLVDRGVVRLYTAGTLLEDELLDPKEHNFLVAVARQKKRYGIASMDVSTGVFRVTETADAEAAAAEVKRIRPRELLFPDSAEGGALPAEFSEAAFNDIPVTYREPRLFETERGKTLLTEQFNTVSLEGFGCEGLRAGIGAAGALLSYAGETQFKKLSHITGIKTYGLSRHLQIDEVSFRNLEIDRNLRGGKREGTLLTVYDRTLTAMGGRLLAGRLARPFRSIDEIRKQHEAVLEIVEDDARRRSIRETLESVSDLERLAARVAMGHANARDLTALKRSLLALPELFSRLSGLTAPLFQYEGDPATLADTAALIDAAVREDAPPTITEGGIIREGYNAELDEWIAIGRDGKQTLAKVEAEEREKTGISNLKVRYNKVFGYYIEVTKTQSKQVPVHYIRKQTLVNAERYITDELKQYEDKVLNAEERRRTLEASLFEEIRRSVAERCDDIRKTAGFIACIDVIANFAEIARENDYVKPTLNEEGIIEIEDGRHPVIEKTLAGERFVPNSIRMDDLENQVLIITGPNMAGKSTILRQVALAVLTCQAGGFVAAKRASLPVIDRIFTRVGALDNLSQGQSTFMVEMQETANILRHATPRSLVIMDEIGRGTSTFDGLSIAWAVAEYLHDLKKKGVKTLFATHYHELTALSETKKRIQNLSIAVKEWNNEIIFLRKLVPGGTNRSYGIQVARLAGLPEKVVSRARKVLAKIESRTDSGANGGAGRNRGFTVSETAAIHDSPGSPSYGPVQLPLFGSVNDVLLGELRGLQIDRMTPMEAINYLNRLKEKAKPFL